MRKSFPSIEFGKSYKHVTGCAHQIVTQIARSCSKSHVSRESQIIGCTYLKKGDIKLINIFADFSSGPLAHSAPGQPGETQWSETLRRSHTAGDNTRDTESSYQLYCCLVKHYTANFFIQTARALCSGPHNLVTAMRWVILVTTLFITMMMITLVTMVSSSPRLLLLDQTRCYSGCGAEVCRPGENLSLPDVTK